MDAWWFKNAAVLYKLALLVAFVGVATWETFRPRQVLKVPISKRWALNGFFLLVTGATGGLIFRIGTVTLAIAVSDSTYGVLNRALIPYPLRAVLGFLLLDFVHYASHYLAHAVPLLWRIHQVHHADADFDLSTGVRFHPGEALFTQGSYLLIIALCTPPPSAVLCYELYSIVQVFFSHANLRLPSRFERVLRLVQVTPELHRIHHCTDTTDQRSNFAAVFSFWDRLFGTYRDDSRTEEEQLQFGLEGVTAAQSVRLSAMLLLPFSKSPALSTSRDGRERLDRPVRQIL